MKSRWPPPRAENHAADDDGSNLRSYVDIFVLRLEQA